MAYRTRQELFDLAWNGLKSQGFERSLFPRSDSCAYRGEGGRRCAIGWAIEDANYSRDLEGIGLSHTRVQQAANVSIDDEQFAIDLQSCHDFGFDPACMVSRLRQFAERHSLTIPEASS